MRMKPVEKDVNAELNIRADDYMVLLGFHNLPPGFRFKLNMYRFGEMRCFVALTKDCLSECFEIMGVGQCPKLIHEAIYEQLYHGQISLRFAHEDDLPHLIECFSRYPCEWQHFDAPRMVGCND